MGVTGGCLCGAIRYEIRGPLLDAGNCHCSMCRRAHGAAFATYANLNPTDVAWTQGEGLVSHYESSPRSHIFVGSKAPWHRIADALPQFEAWPPGDGWA